MSFEQYEEDFGEKHPYPNPSDYYFCVVADICDCDYVFVITPRELWEDKEYIDDRNLVCYLDEIDGLLFNEQESIFSIRSDSKKSLPQVINELRAMGMVPNPDMGDKIRPMFSN